MYGPYTLAFRYLKAHEVAFFTMTTPLFVAMLVILGDRFFGRPHWHKPIVRLLLASGIATFGGVILAGHDHPEGSLLVGAGLVQVSNFFFSLGLFLWARWFEQKDTNTLENMAPFFLGAFLISLILCVIFSNSINLPSGRDWLAVMWLGVISSGLGFYLWNKGALAVNDTTLSVSNNLKLPIAILISILFFNESTNIKNLLIGLGFIAVALWIGDFRPKTKHTH